MTSLAFGLASQAKPRPKIHFRSLNGICSVVPSNTDDRFLNMLTIAILNLIHSYLETRKRDIGK